MSSCVLIGGRGHAGRGCLQRVHGGHCARLLLEQCITAREAYTFRILGKSEGLSVPWRTVVFGIGNNVSWSDDINRRLLVARLESGLEENRPMDTYVHHGGPLEIPASRADLIEREMNKVRHSLRRPEE